MGADVRTDLPVQVYQMQTSPLSSIAVMNPTCVCVCEVYVEWIWRTLFPVTFWQTFTFELSLCIASEAGTSSREA